jgi:predicted nucleic acid-binding protein
MIVYVESNFVVELALEQEEQKSARAILDAAAVGSIDLRVPVFSICEPYSTVTRRMSRRERVLRQTQEELRDLQRSAGRRELAETLAPLVSEMFETTRFERVGVENVVAEVLAVATVLPLAPDVVEDSRVHQGRHDLDPSDAVVYSSVVRDAGSAEGEKLFVTRNSKDFGTRAIRDELAEHQCELAISFAEVAGRIG